MTGSLRQRGLDNWQLRVYVGTDAITGKQRWATTTVHGSRRFATRQLAEFVRQVDDSKVRAGTIAELLDRWVDVAGPTWEPSTRRENRSIIECHLKPKLGHLRVGELTTMEVDEFYGDLLRRGRADGSSLSPSRVGRIHGVLYRAFTQAVNWGWVWVNPVSTASPPRELPAEVHPPTAEAVRALLASVRDVDPELFTFLHLGASTGARRSQLLGLRWGEGDEEPALVPCRHRFGHAWGAGGSLASSGRGGRAWWGGVDGGVVRVQS